MNNNRLIRPDAVNIETVYAAGPLAQPACTVLQAPGQMKMLVMGGLTKVEFLAGQIAAGVVQPGVLNEGPILIKSGEPDENGVPKIESMEQVYSPSWPSSSEAAAHWSIPVRTARDAEYEQRVAACALNIAEAITAESERRTKERQQPTESE